MNFSFQKLKAIEQRIAKLQRKLAHATLVRERLQQSLRGELSDAEPEQDEAGRGAASAKASTS